MLQIEIMCVNMKKKKHKIEGGEILKTRILWKLWLLVGPVR